MTTRPQRAGFTLIEVVGAFFLMVVILVYITGFFIENGRQRDAATELMRERLSAAGALDLLSDDLTAAVFVGRGEGEAPEDHAWRFQADESGEHGATRLRFVTQNAPRSNPAEHASGWVEVAYFLQEDRQGQTVLWRWLSPRPPSDPDAPFPDSSDPGSMRVAVGVDAFGIRFLDAEGEWLDEWDSTYEPPDEALPQGVEISLALLRKARVGESPGGTSELPGFLHTRRIALEMRPIDVAALLELGATGQGDEAGCYTVARCLDEGDDDWYVNELDSGCSGDDELCDLLENPDETCWSRIESRYPQVAARAPGACGS
ncbi:MAG TPA: hypothetical protein ENI85_17360 [Deltaproteobacteria bacterium]|nr:hypothetical protein [Deltaproteobacteria bacterium]